VAEQAASSEALEHGRGPRPLAGGRRQGPEGTAPPQRGSSSPLEGCFIRLLRRPQKEAREAWRRKAARPSRSCALPQHADRLAALERRGAGLRMAWSSLGPWPLPLGE